MGQIDLTAYNALVDDSGSNADGTTWNKTQITNVLITPINNALGVTQTTAVTGAQNNFALSTGCRLLRCTNTTDVTFSGFSAGVDDQLLIVSKVSGAGNVFIKHLSGSSSAANQCTNIATSGDTPISTNGAAAFVYDGTSALWRLVAHEQGEWITPTYNGADWTAATGTWTVDSGDVLANRYFLRGRQLFFQISAATTSVSATPANLAKTLFGFTASGRNDGTIVYSDNGGTNTGGQSFAADTVTAIQFLKFSGSFSAATNTTVVLAEGFVRVQ